MFDLGLGRATLRGIKQCPKCKASNGTRATFCKNKCCDMVFKGCKKKRAALDACKLVMNDPENEIISVRVRDQGPEYRNFVKITKRNFFLHDGNSEIFSTEVMYHRVHCYCCEVSDVCQHIEAAMSCSETAEVLNIKYSAMNLIKNRLQEGMNTLAGPLVQKVSQRVFAVKCENSPKHNLGILHLTINPVKIKSLADNGCYCPCLEFRTVRIGHPKSCIHLLTCIAAIMSCPNLQQYFEPLINIMLPTLNNSSLLNISPIELVELPDYIETDNKHKVHITDMGVESTKAKDLAIGCASSQQFNRDFKFDNASPANSDQQLVTLTNNLTECQMNELLQLTDQDSASFIENLPVEILSDDFSEIGDLDQDIQINIIWNEMDTIEESIDQFEQDIPAKHKQHQQGTCSKRRKKNTDVTGPESVAPETVRKLKEKSSVTKQTKTIKSLKGSSKECKVKSSLKIEKSSDDNDKLMFVNPDVTLYTKHMDPIEAFVNEKQVSIGFLDWLSSVTESINETMQYHGSGRPPPLVFQICKNFYDCLQERFTVNNKKRLPNSVTSVQWKGLGDSIRDLCCYRYILNNVLQVQRVFFTPQIALDIIRSFTQNSDGSYTQFVPDIESEIIGPDLTENLPVRIKPIEHKTYLKVGNMNKNKNDPTPFIIEWIPDILPRSKVGELRIQFEYGHQLNGRPVPPPCASK